MSTSRKLIKVKLPEAQLKEIIVFTNDMLQMIETDTSDLSEEEAYALKKIRHSFNKMLKQFKDQTDDNNTSP
jgi:hypothetical protein